MANVAAITALAFGIAPYLVRPLRRILAVVIVLVSLAAMYLGAGFPSDVLGGLLLGFAVAALVRVAFGVARRASRRSPRWGARSRTWATRSPPSLRPTSASRAPRSWTSCSTTGTISESTRSAATSATRASRRRSGTRRCTTTPASPCSGAACQQVEHIGFALMLAERAKVRAARLVAHRRRRRRCRGAGHHSAGGHADRCVAHRAVTDAVLGRRLAPARPVCTHAGIAHGNLDVLARRRRRRASVAFDDFSSCRRHRRAVLVRPRRRRAPGAERPARRRRARHRGRGRRAREGADGAVIPVVQPAALPAALTRGRQASGQGTQAAAHRARHRHRRRGRPSAQDQAAEPGEHRHAGRDPARPRDRDPQPRGHQLGVGPEPVRERHLGLGAARVPALPTRADGVGHCAAGLREQGPAVRPHRAHPARVHVPEPDHAERHRRHRAAARLPAQAGRPRGVRRERHGAQHRRRRRDPDGPVPHRRGASPRPRSTPAAAATPPAAPP